MALDGIGSLVEGAAYVVVYWRIVLCIVASSVIGLVVVHVFPWFTGLQGIALGALGFLPGIAWQVLAAPQPAPGHERATSTGAAAGLGLVIGLTWGAASSRSFTSFVAGVPIFVLLAWLWLRVAREYPSLLSGNSGVVVLSAAIGYFVGGAIGHFAL